MTKGVTMVNVRTCIEPVYSAMTPEEKGLLHLVLTHGKRLQDELGESLQEPKVLAESAERMGIEEVVSHLNSTFEKGFGVVDWLRGRWDDYGKQLDYLINKVLLKALKATRPIFKQTGDDLQGALARERWICEKLLESMWDRLPEDVKKELSGDIEQLLRESGIDAATASRVGAGIVAGGLTAARTILGFNFHILTAQIANVLVRALAGRGLSVAANAALQRIVGVFFGPIGWVISIILLLPMITGWLLPRKLDKYVPAVFLIGLKRMQLETPQPDERMVEITTHGNETKSRRAKGKKKARALPRKTTRRKAAARFRPDSVPYRDKRNVAAVLACLMGAARDDAARKQKILQRLFERLSISEKDAKRIAKYADGRHRPERFAAAIREERTRWLLLYDLLVLSMSDKVYDARDREGLRYMANALQVPWANVAAAEDEIAKGLLHDQRQPQYEPKKAPPKGRWWKVALVALAGGAALAVTGALAAPAIGGAIGTYFMGLSGAAATSAGLAALGGGAVATGGGGIPVGTALVTALFGGSGAAVFGRKMVKRTGAVEEFEFQHLGGRGMHVYVAVSGFLSEGEDSATSWAALNEVVHYGERYALRWESKRQLDLGIALGALWGKNAAKSAAQFWARRASKVASRALKWPTLVLSLADLIDDPWHLATDRAEKTGVELAEALRQRCFGNRPVTLIGFSLGASVIFHALETLAQKRASGIVDHAILMGGAVSADAGRWDALRPVVAGRLVNAYCTTDWVLAFLYRLAEMTTHAAGLGPVDSKHVENIDVTDLARGHLCYRDRMKGILLRIGIDGHG